MSLDISKVFQDSYDSEVKRKNTSVSKLYNTVYTKANIIGKTAFFRKAGDGLASKHNPGSDVNFMNTKFEQVPCNIEDWEAFDFADKPSRMKFNFEEASVLADVASGACGRRQDQIIIDALNKSKKTPLGGNTTVFNVDFLTTVQEELDDNDVPQEDRYILWTANQRRQLLQETKVTSNDYAEVKALVHGQIDYFLGFKFIVISNRKEGGLPRGDNYHQGFVYQKRHVGFVKPQDIKTSIEFLPEKRGLMVGAEFSSGATIIDEDGVIPFKTKILL